MELVERIVGIIELIGIVAFAISGAMVGVQKKLDIFGIIVLGITTALGGGVIRDLLLGRVPPMMFQKPIYAILATIFSI
ncbi:MAG: TRIC cation channel family protein, partial [Acetivibrio sp.]